MIKIVSISLVLILLLCSCNQESPTQGPKAPAIAESSIPVASVEEPAKMKEDSFPPPPDATVIPSEDEETSSPEDIPPPPPPPPHIEEISDGPDMEEYYYEEEEWDESKYGMPDPETEPEPEIIPEEPVFSTAEEMPYFIGHGEITGDYKEKAIYGDKKLLEFVYSNLKYPTLAKEAGAEGIVVIGMIVNKEGKLEKLELVRDPGLGMGEEALRVLQLINELPKPWAAGKEKGEPIKVQLYFPVRFKLPEDSPKG